MKFLDEVWAALPNNPGNCAEPKSNYKRERFVPLFPLAVQGHHSSGIHLLDTSSFTNYPRWHSTLTAEWDPDWISRPNTSQASCFRDSCLPSVSAHSFAVSLMSCLGCDKERAFRSQCTLWPTRMFPCRISLTSSLAWSKLLTGTRISLSHLWQG